MCFSQAGNIYNWKVMFLKMCMCGCLPDYDGVVNVRVLSEIHLLFNVPLSKPHWHSLRSLFPRTRFFLLFLYNCDCHNHRQRSSGGLLPGASCLSSAGKRCSDHDTLQDVAWSRVAWKCKNNRDAIGNKQFLRLARIVFWLKWSASCDFFSPCVMMMMNCIVAKIIN